MGRVSIWIILQLINISLYESEYYGIYGLLIVFSLITARAVYDRDTSYDSIHKVATKEEDPQ